MVGITNGKSLGQSKLKWNIGAGVIAHHIRPIHTVRLTMRRQPSVHAAVIPGLMLHLPAMVGGGDFLRTCLARVQMKGQQEAVGIFRIRLMKDRFSGGQLQSPGVVESAHSCHSAKVVIKRAVFLHQQDNMLDIAKRAGPRRLRERPP